MASELKVDKISPAAGTAFTLGDSGDTFTVPSGATIVNSGTATGFNSAGAFDLNGAVLTRSQIDMNGTEIILDADADTSITADTDDQIDVKIGGADDFQFTANTFTIPSGSTVAIAAGGAITNAGSMAPDITSTGKAMILGL